MKKKEHQNGQMQFSFDRLLMANFVVCTLSWASLLSFLSKSGFKFWITGVVLLITGVILFTVLTILKFRFKHAYQYYFSVYILAIPVGLLAFDAGTRLSIAATNFESGMFYLFLAMNVFIIVGGIISQVRLLRMRLGLSFNKNVKSGKLNIQEGYWDLKAPLYLNPSEAEDVKIRRWNRLAKFSPIVTALSLTFARTIEGNIQTLAAAIGVYIFCYIAFWGYAKYLAIAFQLLEWEKRYDKQISI
jgi:hypothetical protein